MKRIQNSFEVSVATNDVNSFEIFVSFWVLLYAWYISPLYLTLTLILESNTHAARQLVKLNSKLPFLGSLSLILCLSISPSLYLSLSRSISLSQKYKLFYLVTPLPFSPLSVYLSIYHLHTLPIFWPPLPPAPPSSVSYD